jgi:hypothetical protein
VADNEDASTLGNKMRESWTIKLTALATAIGTLVAVIALFAGQSSASNDIPPLPTANPPVPPNTSTAVPTPPSATSTTPTTPQTVAITRFEIVPDEFQQIGQSSFRSYRNGSLDFLYEFVVESAGENIQPCTITSTITNIGTGEVIQPGEARCPSYSFFIKRALKAGSYRIDATVYAPELDASADATYTFVIEP